jgi:hypothetical protein
MKKLYTMVLAAALVGTFTSCDDFLDYTPTAVVDEDKAFSEPDKMVNSAYAMLGDCWYSYPFNLWPYGDLSSDDCLKGGGGTGDTGYHDVEIIPVVVHLSKERSQAIAYLCTRVTHRSCCSIWPHIIFIFQRIAF